MCTLYKTGISCKVCIQPSHTVIAKDKIKILSASNRLMRLTDEFLVALIIKEPCSFNHMYFNVGIRQGALPRHCKNLDGMSALHKLIRRAQHISLHAAVWKILKD